MITGMDCILGLHTGIFQITRTTYEERNQLSIRTFGSKSKFGTFFLRCGSSHKIRWNQAWYQLLCWWCHYLNLSPTDTRWLPSIIWIWLGWYMKSLGLGCPPQASSRNWGRDSMQKRQVGVTSGVSPTWG